MAIQRNTDQLAYSFHKFEDSGETHIFEGTFTGEDTCNISYVSICKKVDKRVDEVVKVKSCLNEQQARIRAANIGRKTCGTCVSHLYDTYDE